MVMKTVAEKRGSLLKTAGVGRLKTGWQGMG